MKTLFSYQDEAITALRNSFAAGHKRPMLHLPTGGGKTVLASKIIAYARERNKRVTFTVPALSLIEQTIEAFWAEGVRDIGVMQADHRMTAARRPVQIASVQTLGRRKYPDADLVIVDEAHRHFASIDRWMRDRPELAFVGLSATPWSRGLGRRYDDLIIVTTTQELIDQGRLSPFKVFAPAHPDLTGVKIVAGDYKEDDLARAMNKSGLVADIVSTWLTKAENRPTLVFAVDRAHAKHLQERFLAAGISAAYQDMNTTEAERAAIRKGFHNGNYAVVCNVGTLTTGVDWDVRCIVLARPTKSEILFVQMVGRALRTAPGKTDALLFDHSDTHLRLGFVTNIHHETLDDGKPKKAKKPKAAAVPRECPSCHYLRPAKILACPNCGGDVIEVRRQKIAGIAEDDGKLRPFVPRHTALVRVGSHLIDQADLYQELSIFAEEKGYRPAFADVAFKELVGKWPERGRQSLVRTVSPAILAWLTNRQKAYFARRRRA